MSIQPSMSDVDMVVYCEYNDTSMAQRYIKTLGKRDVQAFTTWLLLKGAPGGKCLSKDTFLLVLSPSRTGGSRSGLLVQRLHPLYHRERSRSFFVMLHDECLTRTITSRL